MPERTLQGSSFFCVSSKEETNTRRQEPSKQEDDTKGPFLPLPRPHPKSQTTTHCDSKARHSIAKHTVFLFIFLQHSPHVPIPLLVTHQENKSYRRRVPLLKRERGKGGECVCESERERERESAIPYFACSWVPCGFVRGDFLCSSSQIPLLGRREATHLIFSPC